MVSDVISDDHLLELAKLAHLHENFLVEALKVFDSLNKVFFGDVAPIGESNCCVGVLVHVLEAHCLTQRRLVMNASAGVPMPARSNFEVERTIYSKMTSDKLG